MSLLPLENDPINFDDVINNGPYPIRFPKSGSYDQDEEWCQVMIDGQWKKIRFHDYHDVYKVPGLYETIFYRTLRCNSPGRMSGLLAEAMTELNIDVDKLRIFDLGAGNGMAGEALQGIGGRKIVGVDLLTEARDAALRDRPWVYDHYVVADLTNMTQEQEEFFKSYRFNVLCTVAALGFGDIPPVAFTNAFNFISNDGLVAFNIKGEFIKSTGGSFAQLIKRMIEEEIIEIEVYKRYQHRLSIAGLPLYYVGIVARKCKDIPKSFITN